MKPRKLTLTDLSIKSFTTSLDSNKSFIIKGGDTEDNTEVQRSFNHCKTTIEPEFGTNRYQVCLDHF